MAEYSTVQLAKLLSVGNTTIHRWLKQGLKAPKARRVGGVLVRIWNDQDVKRAREYKAVRYYKGGGRKKKAK